MEKITILGSSNAVAKADQQNAHLLVETRSRKIMVDCGNHPAASLGRAGVTLNQVTDLILTHFHADHLGSLPLLIMDMWLEKRSEPLNVYGLPVTLEKVGQLLDLYDWKLWKDMFPVVFTPVSESGESSVISDGEIQVISRPVQHLIPTIGLRFERAGGSTYAYTSDTEPCDAVLQLAAGVDVLIHESAGPGKGHTSPAQAGESAARSGAKRLVMIHYEHRRGAETLKAEARSTFSGLVDLSVDGMVL